MTIHRTSFDERSFQCSWYSTKFSLYLDPLDELGLVFPDGSSDVGPDEEGVEPGEDPEHLVGVLGGAELEESRVIERSSKNGKDDLATWLM